MTSMSGTRPSGHYIPASSYCIAALMSNNNSLMGGGGITNSFRMANSPMQQQMQRNRMGGGNAAGVSSSGSPTAGMHPDDYSDSQPPLNSSIASGKLGSNASLAESATAVSMQQAHQSMLDAEYYPSAEECIQMSNPISDFLTRCTCYDMLGTSTQVVVVDSTAALKIPFIAAQETRLSSCIVWDPENRRFIGVLSPSDYLRVLLYCDEHPEEAANVSNMSVAEWMQKVPRERPSEVTTVYTETSIKNCLSKMYRHNIHRVIAVAPKEEDQISIVSAIHFGQITEYLGAVFFSIENATITARRAGTAGGSTDGDGNSVGGGTATNSIGSVPNVGNTSVTGNDAGFSTSGTGGGPGNNSMTGGSIGTNNNSISSNRGGGGAAQQQSSAAAAGAAGKGGAAASTSASAAGAGAAAAANRARAAMDVSDMSLPVHVRNILASAQAESGGVELASLLDLGPDSGVGPYRSIFDVPFLYVPKIGKHRNTPIFATMKSTLKDVIKKMIDYDIHSLAVCNSTEEMVILDVISRSDIMRMEVQGDYNISMSVQEALSNRIGSKVFVFHEKDSLRDIFVHFIKSRVKEIFLVDPDTDKLLGQLCISEFLCFLVFGILKEDHPKSSNSRNIAVRPAAPTSTSTAGAGAGAGAAANKSPISKRTKATTN